MQRRPPPANEAASGVQLSCMERSSGLTCRAALPDRVCGHHLTLRRTTARYTCCSIGGAGMQGGAARATQAACMSPGTRVYAQLAGESPSPPAAAHLHDQAAVAHNSKVGHHCLRQHGGADAQRDMLPQPAWGRTRRTELNRAGDPHCLVKLRAPFCQREHASMLPQSQGRQQTRPLRCSWNTFKVC